MLIIYDYKIFWIARPFWLVYQCFLIALWKKKMTWAICMVCCLQVVRIYSFMKEIRLYKPASCIVILFVKTENNNFLKEIKNVLRAFSFTAQWKPRLNLRESSIRWKTSIASRVFINLLSNSPKRSPRLSCSYEGTVNMLYFANEG